MTAGQYKLAREAYEAWEGPRQRQTRYVGFDLLPERDKRKWLRVALAVVEAAHNLLDEAL